MANMPIETLVKLVRANLTRSKKIARELKQSFPIPVVYRGRNLIAFMYFYRGSLPPSPPQISSPRYLAIIDPETGDIVKVNRVEPKDFHIDLPPDQPLGQQRLLPQMTMDEYMMNKKRLYELYDYILHWYTQQKLEFIDEERRIVKEFVLLFRRLAEKPLLPFYESLNMAFFEWLRRVSAST